MITNDMDKIWTVSGKMIDPANPDPALIDIEDIAHALSMICRFGGHIEQHYSVAEHCLLLSDVVPRDYALEALMDDMGEAYVGDVISPVKRLLSSFKPVEKRMLRAIYKGLDVEWSPRSKVVEFADANVLAAESIFHHHQPMPISDEGLFTRAMTWLRTDKQFKATRGGWDIKGRFVSRFYELKP